MREGSEPSESELEPDVGWKHWGLDICVRSRSRGGLGNRRLRSDEHRTMREATDINKLHGMNKRAIMNDLVKPEDKPRIVHAKDPEGAENNRNQGESLFESGGEEHITTMKCLVKVRAREVEEFSLEANGKGTRAGLELQLCISHLEQEGCEEEDIHTYR